MPPLHIYLQIKRSLGGITIGYSMFFYGAQQYFWNLCTQAMDHNPW